LKEPEPLIELETNTEFEVKDIQKQPKKRSENNIITQREIEFDISGSKKYTEDIQSAHLAKTAEIRKAAERVKNLKRTYEKLKEMNLSSQEANMSIEEMENQPAYMRRNFEINDSEPSKEKKISKFSLINENDKQEVKLRDNNRYLHENVD
jgi:cell division protein FtsZ